MNAVKEFFSRHFGAQGVKHVLSAEERFNGASALSAHALSVFDDIVDDLESANRDLAQVQLDADAEIARLTELSQSAARQSGQNHAVVANVRRLVQPPVDAPPAV